MPVTLTKWFEHFSLYTTDHLVFYTTDYYSPESQRSGLAESYKSRAAR